jgi:Peptidase family M28/FG-GAP-like repeat
MTAICLACAGTVTLNGQVAPRVTTVFDASRFKASWNRQMTDVNGDGRADLAWRHGGRLMVRLSTGTGFGAAQVWGGWPTAWELKFGDVNGDGRADAIGRQAHNLQGLGTYIYVSLSTGSGFGTRTLWTYWSPGADYKLGDFNGDGRQDLIGRVGDYLHVAISTGGGFLASQPWTYWNPAADYLPGDFTGDGKWDIIGRTGTDVHVARSTGTAFLPSSVWTYWNNSATLTPGDFNGDGRADIAGTLGADVHVAYSSGNAFSASTVWGRINSTDEPMFADVTGDRRADLCLRRAAAFSVATAKVAGQFNAVANWVLEADLAPLLLSRVSQSRLQATVIEFCQRFGRRAPAFVDKREGFASNIQAAENYIAGALRSYGYFVFVEPVYFNGGVCDQQTGFCGNNIVALRPGFNSTSAFLDVTAHYDGGYHNDDVNGAKDNATGVASALEIARVMADTPTQHSVRFVFFAAEEVYQDAPGSLSFVSSPNGAADRTIGALNTDLTGTPDNVVTIWYRGRSAFEFGQVMAKQNAIYGLGMGVASADISDEPEDGYRVQSDERSYAMVDLTAITSLGGGWKTSGYHTAADTPANVNFSNVHQITKLNLATLLALEVSGRF